MDLALVAVQLLLALLAHQPILPVLPLRQEVEATRLDRLEVEVREDTNHPEAEENPQVTLAQAEEAISHLEEVITEERSRLESRVDKKEMPEEDTSHR